jgi:hypothetical protein
MNTFLTLKTRVSNGHCYTALPGDGSATVSPSIQGRLLGRLKFGAIPAACEGNGMTLHNYLLFVSASIVLVLVPGPDMVYLRGYRTRRETEERCFSGWKTQSGIEPFLKTGVPQ